MPEKTMNIRQLEYWQHRGEPNEWTLEPFRLGQTNLLVGRNATGKSRTLAILNSLARCLAGKVKIDYGNWRVEFEHDGRLIIYELSIAGGDVTHESLAEGIVPKLTRDQQGEGSLHAVEAGRDLRFKVPVSAPAVLAKRDLLQHPFLEPLIQWAEALRFYEFGGPMGKGMLAIFRDGAPDPDPSIADQVVGLFRRGMTLHGQSFQEAVCGGLSEIGYDVESVSIMPLPNVVVAGAAGPSTVVHGLAVKERDLPLPSLQTDISQGMFRALSIIIHLSYAELAARPSCIVIDDIGEGLDFDRSTRLIRLLVDRAQSQQIQLIMSSNDRFVMNAVPLECWQVLFRSGSKCSVLNEKNASGQFEEFRLTGLNNFDLLRSNFLGGRN